MILTLYGGELNAYLGFGIENKVTESKVIVYNETAKHFQGVMNLCECQEDPESFCSSSYLSFFNDTHSINNRVCEWRELSTCLNPTSEKPHEDAVWSPDSCYWFLDDPHTPILLVTQFDEIKFNIEKIEYDICDIQFKENKIFIDLNWIFEGTPQERKIISKIPYWIDYEIIYHEGYSDYFISPITANTCDYLIPHEVSVVIIPKGAAIEGNEMLIPEVITVVLGVNNTVTWVNHDDTAHGISSDKGGVNAWGTSGVLNPGKTYSHTFNESGVFPYHGEPHPWMTGTVIVLEKTN